MDYHRLSAINQPFTLTDDEWGMLAQNPKVRERFGLGRGGEADVEALIRGALSTYAARFGEEDYEAVYILQDTALALPPLVLTYPFHA